MTAPALVTFECPTCALRYTAHPAATVTCTHAGTRHDAKRVAVAVEVQPLNMEPAQ